MDLGEAFRAFNPELRDMLRDVAASQERDAMALGELEAVRTNAAQRMGDIETTLKKAADEGQISHVRLPSFERGFRMRTGKELGALYQEKLTARLDETTQVENRLDPEKVIAETYADVTKQIHSSDLYARLGFEEAAQGITAGFRQRSAEAYTSNYKKAAEGKMADEGSEIALQLAAAPHDQADAYRASVRANLDELRKELPVAKVNEFYTTRVVAPAVDKLVSNQKFTEARNLVDEMERVDVTGKGGLLGQTSVGKSVFSDLRAKIEREARYAEHEAFSTFRQKEEMTQHLGELDAASVLQKVRMDNSGRLPPDARFKFLDEYRKANANDPLKVSAFEKTFQVEYENEDKWRSNSKLTAELEVSLQTLRKDDLEAGRARLDALFHSGEVAPSDYVRLTKHVEQLQALYGAIDEQDFKRLKLDLYADPTGIAGMRTVNFGDKNVTGELTSEKLWSKLPQELQATHEQRVMDYFSHALEDGIRAVGDPNKVPAEKAKVLDAATLKTREYAYGLLRELSGVNKQRENTRRVEEQAKAVRMSRLSRGFDVVPHLGNYTAPLSKKGIRFGPFAGQFGPAPEADEASIRIPASSFKEWLSPGMNGRENLVNLPDLAKDIQDNPDEAKALKSKAMYGYVKSRLGFTPDEVKSGVTKHGVPFDPSAIDPRHISVFRSREELEKAYNSGQPTTQFFAVGDALDPKDKLTPEQFYLAQLALFSKR